MSNRRHVIGCFGGTFDPIHNGHLRMALEFRQRLPFDEMRLVPCHRPAHRETPTCTSFDRAAMTRLAVVGSPWLSVDERELKADGPSFTVDTLMQMRQELGSEVSLCWCVGMDSLVTLNIWSRWQSLLDYGHLVVAARPGWQLPEQGEVALWLRDKITTNPDELWQRPGGKVLVVQQSLLEISATDIRQQIAAGLSPEYLLPDPVWHYIKKRGLYRASQENTHTEESIRG